MAGESLPPRGVLDLELPAELPALLYRWAGMCFTLGSNWKWGPAPAAAAAAAAAATAAAEFGDIAGDCDLGGLWGPGDREWLLWELGLLSPGEGVFSGEPP